MKSLTPMAIDLDAIDRSGLRRALGRFATGVTVVTTRTARGRLDGLTANSFSAVSLDPPLVLWSLRRDARSLPSFVGAEHFAISVLAAEQQEIARLFSAQADDRFAIASTQEGIGGCPLVVGSLAHFECRLESKVEGGDHLIFIGRVLKASHRDGDPLIFANGRYCGASALISRAAAE